MALGYESSDVGTYHVLMLSGDPVHGMGGIREFHTGADERAAIVALRSKSFVEALKETLDPFGRPSRTGFDETREPLSKQLILALKRSHYEVFFGTKILVKRHPRNACFLENGVNTYSVKALCAKYSMGNGEKVIPFSRSHCRSIHPSLSTTQ